MLNLIFRSLCRGFINVQEMKQQFELNERLEREKMELQNQQEDDVKKLDEEFQQRRSVQLAEQKKLVI